MQYFTFKLSQKFFILSTPVEGLEPSTSDLKSNILPSKLHRLKNFRMVGIEPTSIDPKSTMLSITLHPKINLKTKHLVRIGIEPISSD